jgi:hypothetical protein
MNRSALNGEFVRLHVVGTSTVSYRRRSPRQHGRTQKLGQNGDQRRAQWITVNVKMSQAVWPRRPTRPFR